MTIPCQPVSLLEAVIAHLEANPERLRANWSVPPEEGRLLYLLTLMMQAKIVVEVGTSIGYSGLWFAKALTQTGGTLHTLDVSPERLDQAQVHFQEAGVAGLIQTHCGEALSSLAILQAQNLPVDVMFLDAHKSHYCHYFQYANRMVRPGGLLIADNTTSHREAMADFLSAVASDSGWEWTDLSTPNGILVARRRGTVSGGRTSALGPALGETDPLG